MQVPLLVQMWMVPDPRNYSSECRKRNSVGATVNVKYYLPLSSVSRLKQDEAPGEGLSVFCMCLILCSGTKQYFCFSFSSFVPFVTNIPLSVWKIFTFSVEQTLLLFCKSQHIFYYLQYRYIHLEFKWLNANNLTNINSTLHFSILTTFLH